MQENTLKYNSQIEYNGNAYIDEKSMPVESYSNLSNFSRSGIFDDMMVTVISDETMHGDLTHYIFKDEKWEIADLTSEILIELNEE